MDRDILRRLQSIGLWVRKEQSEDVRACSHNCFVEGGDVGTCQTGEITPRPVTSTFSGTYVLQIFAERLRLSATSMVGAMLIEGTTSISWA